MVIPHGGITYNSTRTKPSARLPSNCDVTVGTVTSSGRLSVPGRLMLHHGIEDGEQLMHARHQHNLFGFTRCDQTGVEHLQRGGTAGRAQRRHIQRCPHGGSSPPDAAPSPQSPESRLRGATPTKAAICPCERRPSSGRSAIRVSAVVRPTPGAVRKRSSSARHSGLDSTCRRTS